MPKRSADDYYAGYATPESFRPRKKHRWIPWLIAGAILTILAAVSVPFIASYLIFGGVPKSIPLTAETPGEISTKDAVEELKNGDIIGPGALDELTVPTAEPGSSTEEIKDQIVDKAKRNIPSVADISQDEILAHTDKVCENLHKGWGPIQLATQMDLPVHGLDERAKFLGLAVSMGCPEYTDEALGWYEQLQKFQSLQK